MLDKKVYMSNSLYMPHFNEWFLVEEGARSVLNQKNTKKGSNGRFGGIIGH